VARGHLRRRRRTRRADVSRGATEPGAITGLPLRVRRAMFKKYIKPLKPIDWCSDPDKWLDNTNIEGVLKAYEGIYPWFKVLGVYPIDFAAPSPYVGDKKVCLEKAMCEVSIPALRAAGYKYAAVVFNLDNHLQSGSHWVACVIDVADPGVYYFDSYGIPPPKQVEIFMKSLANDEPGLLKGRVRTGGRRRVIEDRIGFNGRRFQYGGTECGMYSLYFIICMIHGMTFREFVKHPVPDKDMIALRDILFANKCAT
jgi:hypothetical protein